MKCTINFSAGMILGVIGQAMFKYSVFLYYSVFCVQVVIIFILIMAFTFMRVGIEYIINKFKGEK